MTDKSLPPDLPPPLYCDDVELDEMRPEDEARMWPGSGRDEYDKGPPPIDSYPPPGHDMSPRSRYTRTIVPGLPVMGNEAHGNQAGVAYVVTGISSPGENNSGMSIEVGSQDIGTSEEPSRFYYMVGGACACCVCMLLALNMTFWLVTLNNHVGLVDTGNNFWGSNSPPPPPPPCVGQCAVTAMVGIKGMTAATFTTSRQAHFKDAVAEVSSHIVPGDVTITAYLDEEEEDTTETRRAPDVTLLVSFSVETINADVGTSITTALTDSLSDTSSGGFAQVLSGKVGIPLTVETLVAPEFTPEASEMEAALETDTANSTFGNFTGTGGVVPPLPPEQDEQEEDEAVTATPTEAPTASPTYAPTIPPPGPTPTPTKYPTPAPTSNPTARPTSVTSRCIPSRKVGNYWFYCDGINYRVTVPYNCGTGCGMIVDIHGYSMTAETQNEATNLRQLAGNEGYIVINPEASHRYWKPKTHTPRVVDAMRQAMSVYAVDAKKVHVTGFSQGAFMTWSILCAASDIVCSVAPLASSGRDWWGGEYGDRNCFASRRRSNPPSKKRSIMYHHGKKDIFAHYGWPSYLPVAQTDAVKRAYGMPVWGFRRRRQGTTLSSNNKHKTTQLSVGTGSNQVTLQEGYHKYRTWLILGLGHCFPTTKTTGRSGKGHHMCWGDTSGRRRRRRRAQQKNAYDWGYEVLQFFKANQCDGVVTVNS